MKGNKYFNETVLSVVVIIMSVVSLVSVMEWHKMILPEPWSFVVVLLVEIPCVVYVILYIVKEHTHIK